ncbi:MULTISPECIES: hypothetical protein [Deefgea]|uniref:Uncharacterized protein n=1 Tax=Deefgea chitinilytica TaxID=570276 RepID=A0ABS2CES4_9NEIS|nr:MULTISPECIES: hypothetical protein [Deefgea]MBM5572636.1 hypothetical protein [Deefgea chitinilytica]MBM9889872.1 hypothetical protein [Deefgea sp. CFH1-16]
MSPITSSSISNVPLAPPSGASNTAVGAAELQKQLQQQNQATRETVKPVAEQVFISKQAQQQFDTYVASAASAAERYDTGNASVSSANPIGVSTEQALDTVQTVQNRQTAAAIAQYAQQQAQADPAPKPEPRTDIEQKPTTSIKAIA